MHVRDFGFGPDEMRMPLTWFHGEQDTNAPIVMVRRAVAELPSARLVKHAGEAHLSPLCNHVDAIARASAGEPLDLRGPG